MDLHELIAELNGPVEDNRRATVEKRVHDLRNRVALDPRSVTDIELVQGIRDLFDLESSSYCLDGADWLMDALSFTRASISPHEVSSAWGEFQTRSNFGLEYWDYPILEAIAYWYFEHKDHARYGEMDMVAHSAAVLEYLFARVRGREASEEYHDILASNSSTILCVHWELKNYERVRFYSNLLELEYEAGRLGEEKYIESMQFREQALINEREASGTIVDSDLLHINASLMRMLWDTWSSRETQIDQLAKTNGKLYEALARHEDSAYPKPARQELLRRFESDWERLTQDTRNHLERGLTFLQDHYAVHSPTAAPEAFFMAVKTEVLTRLFLPIGLLDEEILRRTNTTNPLKLLISYGKGGIRDKRDREIVRTALLSAGCSAGLVSHVVVSGLKRLVDDRDQIAHQESRKNRPYTLEDLHRCRSEVWAKGWLVPFFRGLLGPGKDWTMHL